ncbi:SurA N-terminal domain-containing protein [Pseudoxanthobacter sp. M-2]|uniref:SurA N-terminal domain-containing protein n=1 Tax=Pseudoxanthobacter sp. M-2 TaxID=3078754 RepID=UPI0038FBF957
MKIARTLLAIGLCLAIGGGVAQAQTSIKVVVGNQPITNYEIAQRAKFIQLTQRVPNATKMATEELIDEKLQLAEARKRGITVSEGEVNDAYAGIASRLKMSPDQLTKGLRSGGVDAKTFKDRLRAQIAWGKVIREKFRATVAVTEQDVIAALQSKVEPGKAGEKATTTEYELSQVIFVVPASASAAVAAQKQKEAEQLRGRFASCAEGLAFAKGLQGVVIKPLGRRMQSDLSDENVKMLDELAVGRLTPPQRTENGVEMVALCNKRVLQSDAAARAAIEGELLDEQGSLMSRRYLRDLKRNAVIEYK